MEGRVIRSRLATREQALHSTPAQCSPACTFSHYGSPPTVPGEEATTHPRQCCEKGKTGTGWGLNRNELRIRSLGQRPPMA